MDKRIDKIIDMLLEDCIRMDEHDNFQLTHKDLLTITQNFLEFKYPKQTRTTTKEAGENAPKIDY